MPPPIAIIAGTGPGTGASIARKFAAHYPVVLLARTPASYEPLVAEITSSGGKALGIATDVSDGASVKQAFARIEKEFGGAVGCTAAVFNASGGFFRKGFLEISEGEWGAGLGVSATGAFHFSQAALPLLLKATEEQYPPTLIFTGATASVKSNALMAGFSTGKWALRALAQSLAREFGPKGVHVGHAIIDGVIDIPKTKEWMKDAGVDAKISPDAIADAYWHLHTQPRSCFTNEIDIRPYVERW